MQIPFVDLKTQYQTIRKDINKAISTVINTSQFIQGEETKRFEEEFGKYISTKYCLGVNSGTDALILGIRALGLPSGSEIIVPANTFIATALAVSENDLKPVFVDIDETDYGMELSDLKRKITSRTRAVIAVHLYGQPEKLDEIKKIIKKSKQKIYLIEDACQAHGAFYKTKLVGNFGIFAAFSFYPGKNLGAYGDGGAIVTNDKKIAEKVKFLREYGQKKKYYHITVGVNSRLDSLQAAILKVKLKHLDKWNGKRQEIAKIYSTLLDKLSPHILYTPKIFKDRQSVFHLYVVRVKKRDGLLKYLQENGIQALIHYPTPLHLQKTYSFLGYKKGDLPIVEGVAEQIISLPIFPDLTKKQIKYIVKKIADFYEKN